MKQYGDSQVLAKIRAAERATLPPHKLPAQRKCLGCQRMFDSLWIGNRLCVHCGGAGAKTAKVEDAA